MERLEESLCLWLLLTCIISSIELMIDYCVDQIFNGADPVVIERRGTGAALSRALRDW